MEEIVIISIYKLRAGNICNLVTARKLCEKSDSCLASGFKGYQVHLILRSSLLYNPRWKVAWRTSSGQSNETRNNLKAYKEVRISDIVEYAHPRILIEFRFQRKTNCWVNNAQKLLTIFRPERGIRVSLIAWLLPTEPTAKHVLSTCRPSMTKMHFCWARAYFLLPPT